MAEAEGVSGGGEGRGREEPMETETPDTQPEGAVGRKGGGKREPMETEAPDTQPEGAVGRKGGGKGEEESPLDLKKTAEEYAQYLVVNSKQDKEALDERIRGVVGRVEEFNRQLEFMHQNITSSSNKMQELHQHTQQLSDLFQRIDQVEAFVNVVSGNVEVLEESISKVERELDPSKLRKVFSSLPMTRKSKPEAGAAWQPPQVFQTRDYFSPVQPELSATARTEDTQPSS